MKFNLSALYKPRQPFNKSSFVFQVFTCKDLRKMKVFALALLALAISANASSISCGISKTDCKEPEPIELCTYQKTCKNVCHDVVSFETDFKMKERCHKECVQRTREVPCTIQKEKCEDVCVTKYKTVTKYRYVLN